MNERIKELRKAENLTQQEFADRIGVKRNTVATYEMGRTTPSDAAVALIVREFDVNEQWLRTGEGAMYRDKTRDEDLAEFFGKALADQTETFRKRFLRVLSRLDEDHWQMLEDMLDLLIDEEKTDS